MSSLISIKVNLDPQKKVLYETQAVQQNKSLSQYLRDRLDNTQDIEQQLFSLKAMIQELNQKVGSSSTPTATSDVTFLLYEVILLLRTIANPGKCRMVHSELERQEIPVWDGMPEAF